MQPQEAQVRRSLNLDTTSLLNRDRWSYNNYAVGSLNSLDELTVGVPIVADAPATEGSSKTRAKPENQEFAIDH